MTVSTGDSFGPVIELCGERSPTLQALKLLKFLAQVPEP